MNNNNNNNNCDDDDDDDLNDNHHHHHHNDDNDDGDDDNNDNRELYPTRTLKWPGRNLVQITCNTSSAYQVQHVVLHATWFEGTAQLLRQSSNRIYFNFILLAKPLNR